MSRLKYCPGFIKDVNPERNIAMNARIRRRRRYVNVLFLAATVTTLLAPLMISDTGNVSFYGLSGQKVEHVITDDKSYEIRRKMTVPLLVGYIGKTNSVMTSQFTIADVSYTGSWAWIDDGNGDYRINFLTSGTFTPAKAITIDVFLIGGGGGGRTITNSTGGGCGGGGGYTGTWKSIALNANQAYTITIGSGGAAGANGGITSAFDHSANGGFGAGAGAGGNGSSGGGANANGGVAGGNGGSDGSNGTAVNSIPGGTGQLTTTKAFGESSGILFGGGGGGGGSATNYNGGTGGNGGGANGGYAGNNGSSAAANTGGGGGGAGYVASGTRYGGSGGSGLCVIRNHR